MKTVPEVLDWLKELGLYLGLPLDNATLAFEVHQLVARASLAASGAPADPTEAKLHLLVAHLEALDSQLTRLGEGEFVEGYQMKTGAWHRILGIIRGDPTLALRRDFEAQIPLQRAAEEAWRKAGEVSQADLNTEVRSVGDGQS